MKNCYVLAHFVSLIPISRACSDSSVGFAFNLGISHLFFQIMCIEWVQVAGRFVVALGEQTQLHSQTEIFLLMKGCGSCVDFIQFHLGR